MNILPLTSDVLKRTLESFKYSAIISLLIYYSLIYCINFFKISIFRYCLQSQIHFIYSSDSG